MIMKIGILLKKVAPILKGVKKGLNPINTLSPVSSETKEEFKNSPESYKAMIITSVLILCFGLIFFILLMMGKITADQFLKMINRLFILLIGIIE